MAGSRAMLEAMALQPPIQSRPAQPQRPGRLGDASAAPVERAPDRLALESVEGLDRAGGSALPRGSANRGEQSVVAPGLEKEVRRSELQALDRERDRSIGGH